jgi:cysteinyl-tRNA synthetase
LVDPSELIRAREEKRAQAEAKAEKKAAAQELERQKKIQKLERGSVPPEQLFKPPNVPEGVYGSWDGQGLPLTDGEGRELSKNQTKKVQKEWAMRRKLHEEYLAWQKEAR